MPWGSNTLRLTSLALISSIFISACDKNTTGTKDSKPSTDPTSALSESKPALKTLPPVESILAGTRSMKVPTAPWSYRPEAKTEKENKAKRLVDQASEQFGKEEFQNVHELTIQATEIAPDYALPWYSRAVIARMMKEKEECRYSIVKACKLDKRFFTAWHLLAGQYKNENRIREATAILKMMTLKDPDNANTWNKIGWEYIDLQNGKSAKTCFIKSIKLDPENANSYAGLGYAYHCMGNWPKAESYYKKSLSLDKKQAVTWRHLSQVLSKQNKSKEYFYTYGEYQKLTKHDIGVAYSKALLLYDSGKEKEAREIINRMIKQHPEKPEGYRGLAIIELAAQQYEKAHKNFSLALEKSPNSLALIQSITECKIQLHKYQEGIKFVNGYLKKYRNNPALLSQLSRLYFLTHEFKKSEEVARYLTKNHPDNQMGWFFLATALDGQNKSKEAISTLKEAVNLNPRMSSQLWANLANFLISAGKMDEAKRAIDKGLHLYPKSNSLQASYGIYYKNKGDLDKAENHLKIAIAGNSNSAFIWNQLAKVYEAKGNKKEQSKALKMATVSTNDTEYVNYYLIGFNLEKLGRKKEAREAMKKAGAISPDEVENILVTPDPGMKKN